MDKKRKHTPANTLDLIGKEFGKLTVIERSGSTEKGNSLWLCKCECGNKVIARGTNLRRNEIISCGCESENQIKNAREKLNTDHTIDGVQVPLITKKVRSDSQTGHKGIYRRLKNGKERFESYITVDKKRKYIGSSTDINKAIEMRKKAEIEYYGDIIKDYNKRMENNERN